MFVWIGCELPEDFAARIREECRRAGEGLVLDYSGFTLPQHISLKISFQAGEDWEAAVSFISELLQKEKEFYVNPKAPEQAGSILWLPFRESGTLRRLHNLLDRDLKRRFGVEQHLFDKAFRFHSTLAVGPAADIAAMKQRLGELPLPDTLKIRAFLLGISATGKSGTYRVVRRVEL